MDGKQGNNQQNNGNYQDYTAYNSYQPPEDNGRKGTNGLQVAGLVFGILAICTSCCYGLPGIIFGITGLICSIIGNNRGKSGVGIAGLVCSIIGLVLGVIALIYYIWAISYLNEIGYLDAILQQYQ